MYILCRGTGGYWRTYQAQQLATPQAFADNPSLVWEFYHYHREVVTAKHPNLAHKVSYYVLYIPHQECNKKILISVLCARDPARCIAMCCMQRYGTEQEEQYTMGSRSTGHIALCRSLSGSAEIGAPAFRGGARVP